MYNFIVNIMVFVMLHFSNVLKCICDSKKGTSRPTLGYISTSRVNWKLASYYVNT